MDLDLVPEVNGESDRQDGIVNSWRELAKISLKVLQENRAFVG